MTALFVSPHFDDVALSCAGTLLDHAARGERTRVITVFAGSPPEQMAVRALHRQLLRADIIEYADVVAYWRMRVEEDTRAMRALATEHVHLNLPDAAFRPQVASWADVWVAPSRELVSQVLEALREPCAEATAIYAPLGVGHHVDHLACFEAVTALSRDAVYYEEFPYAARSGALSDRLADVGPLVDRVVDTTGHVDKRIEAIGCYASQVAGIFGNNESIAPAIRAFVAARGGERIWQRA